MYVDLVMTRFTTEKDSKVLPEGPLVLWSCFWTLYYANIWSG